MERLWSPWRSEYVSRSDDSEACFLCDNLARDEDEKTGILYRGEEVFVVLNRFPYNTGHLMIAPNRHAGEPAELSDGERHALADVTFAAVEIVRRAMSPHGFNVGMNLGRVAGAGVPDHLHVHVVPRWGGDTNYMPVVANTKVLPESLADTDAKLRPLFARLHSA
jgi:ATP adenylyltransferase